MFTLKMINTMYHDYVIKIEMNYYGARSETILSRKNSFKFIGSGFLITILKY